MAKDKRISVGRYARVTTAARVDMIGKVTHHTASGARLTVPNWQADGWPLEVHADWDELERSSATACAKAAAKR